MPLLRREMWQRIEPAGVWKYEDSGEARYTALLLAGIHPEEEAAVLCLEELVRDSRWLASYRDIRVIAVPCRNPRGYHIRQCFGAGGLLEGSLLLENDCCSVYTCGEDYLLIRKPTLVRSCDRQGFWSQLTDSLREGELKGFVHILSLRKAADLRANTYYFTGERLVDLNGIGQYPRASYLCDVESLVRTYHPDLVIDLHEGRGTEAYLYVDEKDPQAVANGRQVAAAMGQTGMPLRKEAVDRERIAEGLFSLGSLPSGRRWIDLVEPGQVFFLESGIENDRGKRIAALRSGVEQCLRSGYRMGKQW